MSKNKVIGLYSPFGDDLCGYYVIEELRNINFHKEDVSLLSLDRPGVKLIEVWQESNTVILIDAIKSNNRAGNIIRIEDDSLSSVVSNLSSHQIGLSQTLAIAKSLNMIPEKLIFFGIEVEKINHDSKLSNKVSQAVNKLVEIIKHEIKENFKHENDDTFHNSI